jgi:hypothetical protein
MNKIRAKVHGLARCISMYQHIHIDSTPKSTLSYSGGGSERATPPKLKYENYRIRTLKNSSQIL